MKNKSMATPLEIRPVTFKKVPRELSRAILKAVQSHLSITCSELRYTIVNEMKRMKLERTIAVDRLSMDIEQRGPAVCVPDLLSGEIYKFIIERRTDENTESYDVHTPGGCPGRNSAGHGFAGEIPVKYHRPQARFQSAA